MVANGFESDVQDGPVQNEVQFDRVMDVHADAKKLPGVRITTGSDALNRPGYSLAPAIVADIQEETRHVDEETFAPVLPVLAFRDIDDLIERANAPPYGLGDSVWTMNVAKGAEVATWLEAGVVWANHHVGLTRDLPFGGVKDLGIGRKGHGIGVNSDMEPQVVVIPKLV